MKKLTLLLAILVPLTFCQAAKIESGVGIVYGKNHVFSFKAPKGWVLDNESGVNQGIHAAFYPKGGSWQGSKVIAYARVSPRDGNIKSVADQVEETVKQFHANGNPKYAGKMVKTVKTESGKVGEIYQFSGDQWGNFEAVAYFVEEKTINFIVLNSREEKVFVASLPAFDNLAKSYLFIGDQYESNKLEKKSKVSPKSRNSDAR